eukprot:1190775-Prorocentrum_minimum.AAC.1
MKLQSFGPRERMFEEICLTSCMGGQEGIRRGSGGGQLIKSVRVVHTDTQRAFERRPHHWRIQFSPEFFVGTACPCRALPGKLVRVGTDRGTSCV